MDLILLQKAMRKDPDAFTALFQQNMQLLYKTARGILSSDEDAADAIQDTILTCWEKIASLKEPKYFRSWMIRILINKCYDQVRRNRDAQWPENLKEAGYHEHSYENAEWREVLSLLDETYRLVMILYYVDELNISEIAGITGTSEGTVRTRLSRGRKKLAALFKNDSAPETCVQQ